MVKPRYIKGDATAPVKETPIGIIIHCCNDIGAWGAGFVLALSRKWPEPEKRYLAAERYCLGEVQFVGVTPDLMVANMIGQHGCGRRPDGSPPIDYPAIRCCLDKVREEIDLLGGPEIASVHAPRFGAGLAGGDWNVIEQIISDELCSCGISVTIYDL
jgi:O-acetyl-ADP-ribose deacetylase (regulator of RNase III)